MGEEEMMQQGEQPMQQGQGEKSQVHKEYEAVFTPIAKIMFEPTALFDEAAHMIDNDEDPSELFATTLSSTIMMVISDIEAKGKQVKPAIIMQIIGDSIKVIVSRLIKDGDIQPENNEVIGFSIFRKTIAEFGQAVLKGQLFTEEELNQFSEMAGQIEQAGVEQGLAQGADPKQIEQLGNDVNKRVELGNAMEQEQPEQSQGLLRGSR